MKSNSGRKSKPKKDSIEDEKANPLIVEEAEPNLMYELEMTMFNEDFKAKVRIRSNRVSQLARDKETFYSIMWMQCGLSMQNHIRNFKVFEAKNLPRTCCGCTRPSSRLGAARLQLKEQRRPLALF